MTRPTNTQFALAVHVLTLLSARAGKSLSSEELAASAGTSPVYARRVLGRLRDAGLVTSRPGVNGGWQAAARYDATTLGDVWRAIHGGDRLLGLHEVSPDCDVAARIHTALEQIDSDAADAIERELDQTTLCDLARRTSAEQPLVSPAG